LRDARKGMPRLVEMYVSGSGVSRIPFQVFNEGVRTEGCVAKIISGHESSSSTFRYAVIWKSEVTNFA